MLPTTVLESKIGYITYEGSYGKEELREWVRKNAP
jgi:hypothetical protein